MAYKILHYPDDKKVLTPEEVLETARRAQKVKMGFEQLKHNGLGPGLQILCEEHGYIKPQYILWNGAKWAVCEFCVRYYCNVGGSKLAPQPPNPSGKPGLLGPDGGP